MSREQREHNEWRRVVSTGDVSPRIHPERKNGLFNPKASYWKGERAETIVKARVATYTKAARKKRT